MCGWASTCGLQFPSLLMLPVWSLSTCCLSERHPGFWPRLRSCVLTPDPRQFTFQEAHYRHFRLFDFRKPLRNHSLANPTSMQSVRHAVWTLLAAYQVHIATTNVVWYNSPAINMSHTCWIVSEWYWPWKRGVESTFTGVRRLECVSWMLKCYNDYRL